MPNPALHSIVFSMQAVPVEVQHMPGGIGGAPLVVAPVAHPGGPPIVPPIVPPIPVALPTLYVDLTGEITSDDDDDDDDDYEEYHVINMDEYGYI